MFARHRAVGDLRSDRVVVSYGGTLFFAAGNRKGDTSAPEDGAVDSRSQIAFPFTGEGRGIPPHPVSESRNVPECRGLTSDLLR